MSHGDVNNPGKHLGHDKHSKDPRPKDVTWCIQDIEWDEDGCLYVKNKQLADMIYQAIWVDKHFCIVGDRPKKGGGGDNKINMMCPC